MENVNGTRERYIETIQVGCSQSLHGNQYLYFLAAINILLSIAATLENILIFVALRKETSLFPPSKLLFRCLTATDLLAGVFPQPLFVIELITVAHQRLELCYTVVSLIDIASALSGVSLCTLTAISVDRLLALLLGLRYRQTVTLRRVCGIVIFYWILAISLSAMRRFWEYVLSSYFISAIIYISLGISALCYIKIYLSLRRHQVNIANLARQENPHSEGTILNIARYRKTVSAALWVQIMLVACYLPYGIISVVAQITEYSPSYNLAYRITITLVNLNSTLNPFLYCWKIRGVRKAVKDTIGQLFNFES